MKKRREVYDLYWYFACERQNIFIKKLNGEPAPWTKDLILQEYKFCNSYRVNDRVSQYLLKNVIYNGKSYSNEDMLFRILLFKLFNKESTWELLLNNFEDINLKNFNFNEYSSVLEKAISNYKGAILMISHDYHFIVNCADYVLLIEDKTIRKMSMRKFRKMIYANHFDKDYLQIEEKKKALEMDIASSLRDTDFERARSLSEKLEEIIKSL